MSNWRYITNGTRSCPLCKPPSIWWHRCSECSNYCTCPVPKYCRVIPAYCVPVQIHEADIEHVETLEKVYELDVEIPFEHKAPRDRAEEAFSSRMLPHPKWRFLTNGDRICMPCRTAQAQNVCTCPQCVKLRGIPCSCPPLEGKEGTPLHKNCYIVFVHQRHIVKFRTLLKELSEAAKKAEKEKKAGKGEQKDKQACKEKLKHAQVCQKKVKDTQACGKGKEAQACSSSQWEVKVTFKDNNQGTSTEFFPPWNNNQGTSPKFFPPNNDLFPPWSNDLFPPWSNDLFPPWSNDLFPPWSNNKGTSQ